MTERYEPDPDEPRYPPGTTPPYQPGYADGGADGGADSTDDDADLGERGDPADGTAGDDDPHGQQG